MRAVLTIGGSDSSAGAGVQADQKTFAALGVYGASVVTAVTAQNTLGVSELYALPPQIVRSQIACVAEDLSLSAVKTGMLATGEIALAVAETVGRFHLRNVVVDPVMAATSGGRRTLLAPDAVSILTTRILPLATLVTPNVDEAAVLSHMRVDSLDTAREAARRIVDLGPAAVVVKGGHLAGDTAIDLLYDGRTFTEFSAPRLPGGPIHGTGCAFASAVAAGLACGDDVPAAVDRAKRYVTGAIEHSLQIGRGARVLDHFWNAPSR